MVRQFGPDHRRTLDAERAFPTEFFAVMGEEGYFGTLLPVEDGGSAAGPAAASVVIEEINRAGGDATTVNAQMTICGTLARDGDEAQRAAWLPKVATGEVRFLSVAATEPDSGADMSTLESTARRDGDDWKKVFISLAEHTRVLILLVRAEEGATSSSSTGTSSATRSSCTPSI